MNLWNVFGSVVEPDLYRDAMAGCFRINRCKSFTTNALRISWRFP